MIINRNAEENNPFLDVFYWQSATLKDVETALDQGANVCVCDSDGLTPLHLAARFSKILEAIELLLDKGANINARDTLFDWTPLHYAASHSNMPSVIELLINRGADIESYDKNGWRPLHLAAAFNSVPEIVTLLMENGADAKAQIKSGLTASFLANDNEHLRGTEAHKKLEEAQSISSKSTYYMIQKIKNLELICFWIVSFTLLVISLFTGKLWLLIFGIGGLGVILLLNEPRGIREHFLPAYIVYVVFFMFIFWFFWGFN